MDMTTIRHKSVEILENLGKVRSLPHENHAEKELLWEKIVRDMKALPKAKPGLRVVYASSLQRASATAELAALTANNLPEIQFTGAIREIQIGQELDPELVAAAENILMDATDRAEAVERLRQLFAHHKVAAPVEDTLENRKMLTNPKGVFEGGDSIQGYTTRIIKGYMATLTHAVEGGTRTIEDIFVAMEEPSDAFIDQVFAIQNALLHTPDEPFTMHNPQAPYPAMAHLCQILAGHRVVFVRHGDTNFSKQKIWTGGNVDTKLAPEGKDAAVETGIILKLYNKTHPNDVRIIQIFGHSQSSAIVEAAICAAWPKVINRSTGLYKVGEPHILDFAPDGILTITPVSRQSLHDELQQDLADTMLDTLSI
jgi:broad specificity phosphatase PhoE